MFSVCIPRVYDENMTYNNVRSVFNKLNIGRVSKIYVMSVDNTPHKRVFVHFSEMFDNRRSLYIRSRLMSDQSVKIVYDLDSPCFWRMYMNKNNGKCSKL